MLPFVLEGKFVGVCSPYEVTRCLYDGGIKPLKILYSYWIRNLVPTWHPHSKTIVLATAGMGLKPVDRHHVVVLVSSHLLGDEHHLFVGADRLDGCGPLLLWLGGESLRSRCLARCQLPPCCHRCLQSMCLRLQHHLRLLLRPCCHPRLQVLNHYFVSHLGRRP
jgi:hypothetical protein